jgi:ABC-type nitrate/sulfonate/bicarbonate transport system substrate-binding protein
MLVWNPWTYLAQQEEGMEVVIMHDGTNANFPWDQSEHQSSYTLSVWAMPEAFIRESPNSAKALMDVMLRGQEYVRDPANREEVLNMLVEWNDQPYELLDSLWDDYGFDTTIGDIYVRDMTIYTDFLFNAGRIDTQFDPMDYTYTGFLEDYNPEYVQIEGNWQP